jgi:hypothetical protein
MLASSSGQDEDGDSMALQNVGILLHHYLASQARRPVFESVTR